MIVILIVGGELNAELEHQTAKDTTTGAPLSMGSRGAFVADTPWRGRGPAALTSTCYSLEGTNCKVVTFL